MTIYTETARFDTGRPMTEDELHQVVPSVFANQAHKSRSERFAVIPTIDVLRGLAKEGFQVVGATQSPAREVGRAPYTKHMLRIRKFGDERKYQVGDTVFEILLKNANDGTCKYEMMSGLFRIRCLNSLVAQSSTVDSVKIRHTGKNIMHDVIDASYRVIGESEKALAAPQDWPKVMLNDDERDVYATAAHMVRFGDELDEQGRPRTAVQPKQLLHPRRYEDQGDDLWRTYNRVQENVIRGGLGATTHDANNRLRRTRTREIKGIDQDLKLNRALWLLSERMAELKAA